MLFKEQVLSFRDFYLTITIKIDKANTMTAFMGYSRNPQLVCPTYAMDNQSNKSAEPFLNPQTRSLIRMTIEPKFHTLLRKILGYETFWTRMRSNYLSKYPKKEEAYLVAKPLYLDTHSSIAQTQNQFRILRRILSNTLSA